MSVAGRTYFHACTVSGASLCRTERPVARLSLHVMYSLSYPIIPHLIYTCTLYLFSFSDGKKKYTSKQLVSRHARHTCSRCVDLSQDASVPQMRTMHAEVYTNPMQPPNRGAALARYIFNILVLQGTHDDCRPSINGVHHSSVRLTASPVLSIADSGHNNGKHLPLIYLPLFANSHS